MKKFFENYLRCNEERTMFLQLVFGVAAVVLFLALWAAHWGLPHGGWRTAVLMTLGWFVAFIVGYGASLRAGIVIMMVTPVVAILVLGSCYQAALHNGVFHAYTLLLSLAVVLALMAAAWPLVDEFVDRPGPVATVRRLIAERGKQPG